MNTKHFNHSDKITEHTKEVILINFTGPFSATSTSEVCNLISQHEAEILDMEQAVIHTNFSLNILVRLASDIEIAMMLKDLVLGTADLDLQVRFTVIKNNEDSQQIKPLIHDKYILTLLSRKLESTHLKPIANALEKQGLKIIRINRLSNTPSIFQQSNATVCIEFRLEGIPEDINKLKANFLAVSQEMDLDIAFQKDTPFRRNRRLVCFDMDSTLIEGEVIDELAMEAGVGEAVAKITQQAMRGEIDFNASLKARVALLKGLPVSALKTISDRLVLTEGAETLVNTLRALGYKTAILSGGFSYFGKLLKDKLNIDYMFANELDIAENKVTGEVKNDIVNGERKAELLKSLAKAEGINLQQVIAVGDGANDLPMLNLAGLGIAFRAKPLVKANAEQAITHLGLDGILYLMGVTAEESAGLNENYSIEKS